MSSLTVLLRSVLSQFRALLFLPAVCVFSWLSLFTEALPVVSFVHNWCHGERRSGCCLARP